MSSVLQVHRVALADTLTDLVKQLGALLIELLHHLKEQLGVRADALKDEQYPSLILLLILFAAHCASVLTHGTVQLGFCSISALDRPIEAAAALAAECGVDALEVTAHAPHLDPEQGPEAAQR